MTWFVFRRRRYELEYKRGSWRSPGWTPDYTRSDSMTWVEPSTDNQPTNNDTHAPIIYIYIYIYIHTRTYTCIAVMHCIVIIYIYMCMCVCVCTYIYIYIYVFIISVIVIYIYIIYYYMHSYSILYYAILYYSMLSGIHTRVILWYTATRERMEHQVDPRWCLRAPPWWCPALGGLRDNNGNHINNQLIQYTITHHYIIWHDIRLCNMLVICYTSSGPPSQLCGLVFQLWNATPQWLASSLVCHRCVVACAISTLK